MEFKGTKGKWKIKHSESKNAFNVVGTVVGGNYKIARIPYLVTERLLEVNKREKLEAESNAKLIAAAPEMFDELKETITDLKILRNQIESESKTNHLFEGMPELIQKWIDRKEQLLTKITE